MNDAPAPAPRSRLPWRRLLAGSLLAVAVVVAVPIWLGGTASGLRALLTAAGAVLPGTLEARDVDGSLIGGFRIGALRLDSEAAAVEIDGLRVAPRGLSLAPLQLDLAEVAAERLRIRLPAAAAPTAPPASLALPLALNIDRLTVAEAQIDGLALRGLAARVALGAESHTLEGLRAELGDRAAPLHVQGRARVATAAPFAVDAQTQLRATLAGSAVQADLTGSGSLRALQLAAELSGNGGRGSARATVDAWGMPPLQALHVEVDELDPAAWSPDAPRARLRVDADLTPVPGPDFALAGSVQVGNAAPASFDRGGLPLRQAQARVAWSAAQLTLDAIDAAFAGGRLRGEATLALTEPADLDARLTLDGVATAEVLSTLRPLRLDGQLQAQRRAGALTASGNLRHRGTPAVAAEFDLRLADERLELRRLRLLAGRGVAELAGTLALAGTGAFDLSGRVERFDPGLLLREVDGEIGGRIEARGQRAPLQGSARFALADSRLLGRPLAGQGEAVLAADGRLRVDATLAVRTASLRAQGTLGERDSRLTVDLTVPQLSDLALPLTGQLEGNAILSGNWPTPALQLQLRAEQLAQAEQSVERVEVKASYAGGDDGALTVAIDLDGHRFKDRPGLSLRRAALALAGRPTAHQLTLDAQTELAQPLRLATRGSWREGRVSGQLTELTSGAPLPVALVAPAPFVVGDNGLNFGPADLRLPRARIEALRLAAGPARIASSGRIAEWRVGHDIAAALAGGNGGLARATLSLRGEWDFTLGAQADGRLLLTREGGDLVLPSGEPLGVDRLQLLARIDANRVQASAVARAARAGELYGEAQAEVERADNGWRLAAQRPLDGRLRADLHDLGFVALLLPDRLRDNLRVGGRLSADVRANGTPAQPLTEGRIDGDGLRLAWVEQGVRLQDGRLRARLADRALVLDELFFTGPPRAVPPDRRVAAAASAWSLRGLRRERPAAAPGAAGAAAADAAESLASSEPGSATLTGRLDLRDFAATARLVAQRLPLVQRPDRWVVASGTADIAFDRNALRIAGKAVADAGFVDVGKPELPRLSADVRVLGEPARGAPAGPPLRLILDLGLDLGPAFYLTGRGLDAQLVGDLRLRAESLDSLRATGTIETRAGTYSAFGHRLTIERGRLNFQGPLDNPGLDVLALRRDLPVVVGVTITRSVASPLIRLYSDPVMSEQETLSWLVLGRPADSDRLDNPLLARAALALFAGGDEGLPTKLLRQLGVDELSIRSGTVGSPGSLLPQRTVAGTLRSDTGVGAAREIVVVGKRINESLTVTYEQALAGAANALLIAYRLSDRLSLVAQAGTNNGLNLVYSVAFD